jgi:hypothetical protein
MTALGCGVVSASTRELFGSLLVIGKQGLLSGIGVGLTLIGFAFFSAFGETVARQSEPYDDHGQQL